MRQLLLCLALAALTGCTSIVQPILAKTVTLTLPDAKGAEDVLTKSAPLMPAGDPWLGCMQSVEGVLLAIQAGPATPEVINGPQLLTEASRLHVLDVMLANMSANAGQAACAQILIGIQLRAAAGATPFGALLPLR
jgi:hypothetical protein